MIKLKIKDQIHFSKRLSFLIGAGVPILEALKMLANSNQSKKQRKVLEIISKNISLGVSLSEALRKTTAFADFAVYLAEVGETSGSLARSLSHLSSELEAKQRLKQQIIGALFYPFFISTAVVLMSIMLISFVFPKILPILSGLNGELPLPTRILIFLNLAIKLFGLYFLGAACVVVTVFLLLFKNYLEIRFRVENLELRLPYIRQFLINYQLINFSRTAGILLESGMVLEQGLILIARHTSNVVYQKAYGNLRQKIIAGERLAFSMTREATLFPTLFREMVEVGEATGRLPETFTYLSELYEMELGEKTKILSSLIEPILMIFMGLIIGGVALSIVLPIYQITANLHH